MYISLIQLMFPHDHVPYICLRSRGSCHGTYQCLEPFRLHKHLIAFYIWYVFI